MTPERIDPWIDNFIDSTSQLKYKKTAAVFEESCMLSRSALARLISGWPEYLKYRRTRLKDFRSALEQACAVADEIDAADEDKPYVEHARISMQERIRMLDALLEGKGSAGLDEALEHYKATVVETSTAS